LRRGDAEPGERAFQRKPRCGLRLPEQITEIAGLAPLALSRRRRGRIAAGAGSFAEGLPPGDRFIGAGFFRFAAPSRVCGRGFVSGKTLRITSVLL